MHGNFYGTSSDSVQTVSRGGKIPLLDIDVQAGLFLRKYTQPALHLLLLIRLSA